MWSKNPVRLLLSVHYVTSARYLSSEQIFLRPKGDDGSCVHLWRLVNGDDVQLRSSPTRLDSVSSSLPRAAMQRDSARKSVTWAMRLDVAGMSRCVSCPSAHWWCSSKIEKRTDLTSSEDVDVDHSIRTRTRLRARQALLCKTIGWYAALLQGRGL